MPTSLRLFPDHRIAGWIPEALGGAAGGVIIVAWQEALGRRSARKTEAPLWENSGKRSCVFLVLVCECVPRTPRSEQLVSRAKCSVEGRSHSQVHCSREGHHSIYPHTERHCERSEEQRSARCQQDLWLLSPHTASRSFLPSLPFFGVG